MHLEERLEWAMLHAFLDGWLVGLADPGQESVEELRLTLKRLQNSAGTLRAVTGSHMAQHCTWLAADMPCAHLLHARDRLLQAVHCYAA